MDGLPVDNPRCLMRNGRYVVVVQSWPGVGKVCGGVGVDAQNMAEALAAVGRLYRVVVVDFSRRWAAGEAAGGRLPVWVLPCGWVCALPVFPGRRFFETVAASVRVAAWLWWRRDAWDAVVTTNYRGLCLIYSLLPRSKPVVVRVSTLSEQLAAYAGGFLRGLRGWGQWLDCAWERMAIRVARHPVSHTEAHIREVARSCGMAVSRFGCVPHGMTRNPAPLWPSPDSRMVFFLGNLEPRKGADTLFEALPHVLEEVPEARFVVAGADVAGLGERFLLGLPPHWRARVSLPGVVDEAQRIKLLRDCIFFVSPARYESFGLTYLEALGEGRPVIGCTGSGSGEVIGPGGVLVTPGDPPALAGAMVRLLRDAALRGKLARAGWEWAGRFSIEASLRELDNKVWGVETVPP